MLVEQVWTPDHDSSASAATGYAPEGDLLQSGARLDLEQAPDVRRPPSSSGALQRRAPRAADRRRVGPWTGLGDPTESRAARRRREGGSGQGGARPVRTRASARCPFDSAPPADDDGARGSGTRAGGRARRVEGLARGAAHRAREHRAPRSCGTRQPSAPSELAAQGFRVLAVTEGTTSDVVSLDGRRPAAARSRRDERPGQAGRDGPPSTRAASPASLRCSSPVTTPRPRSRSPWPSACSPSSEAAREDAVVTGPEIVGWLGAPT